MSRIECALIAFLALVSVTTLALVPPPVAEATQSAQVAATPILADTVAATRRPTSTATPSPEPSATPTASPTAVPPTATDTVTASPTASPTATATATATVYPFDTHSELERFVYVDQNVQRMYVFESGKLLRDIPCSCGLPDDDKYTPAATGYIGEYWPSFFAFDVYADDAWYLYKSAGSILIHSLPYVYQNGHKVYQDRDALGVQPASHGCVRISPEDAVWFTSWNPAGVYFEVSEPYLDKWRHILYGGE